MRFKITLVSPGWSGTEYVEANTLPEAYERAFSNEYVRLAKSRPMATPRRISAVEEAEPLPFEQGSEDESYPSAD